MIFHLTFSCSGVLWSPVRLVGHQPLTCQNLWVPNGDFRRFSWCRSMEIWGTRVLSWSVDFHPYSGSGSGHRLSAAGIVSESKTRALPWSWAVFEELCVGGGVFRILRNSRNNVFKFNSWCLSLRAGQQVPWHYSEIYPPFKVQWINFVIVSIFRGFLNKNNPMLNTDALWKLQNGF